MRGADDKSHKWQEKGQPYGLALLPFLAIANAAALPSPLLAPVITKL